MPQQPFLGTVAPTPETPRRSVQRERWLVCSKIHGEAIFSPGMEDKLPPSFPMTGPHWSDYVAPAPAPLGGIAGEYQQERAALLEEDEDADVEAAAAMSLPSPQSKANGGTPLRATKRRTSKKKAR